MKLSRKMYLGFSIIIALVIIQTALSVRDLRFMKTRLGYLADEYMPEVILASDIQYEIAMAGYHMRAFFASLNENDYSAGFERLQMLNHLFGELKDLNNRQKQLVALSEYVSAFEPDIRKYSEMCELIHKEAETNRSARAEINRAFGEFKKNLESLRANFNDDLAHENAAYQKEPNKASADAVIRRHRRFLELSDMEIRASEVVNRLWFAITQQDNAEFEDITADLEEVARGADEFHRDTRQAKNIPFAVALTENVRILFESAVNIDSANAEMARLGSERLTAFNTVLNHADAMAQSGENGIRASVADSLAGIDRNIRILLICVVVAAILGVAAALMIVRGIVEQIETVTEQLQLTGDVLDQKAGVITSTSDDLARLAESQAGSLQETTTVLEQVTSMARKNADNVKDTNTETMMMVRQIEEGAGSVRDMGQAMEEINDSAEKIGHIIKTIEEIAFQTNLLALNAAVEAARAGEAGKGFAVVADEVRNLAQRSAQSARDTAELIEGTVERVRRGGDISKHLGDVFEKIEVSAQNAGRLVGESATAIREQAQGVDQVSSAMAEIGSATQQNAEDADKVRLSSVDIGEEARKMLDVAGILYGIVHGVERKRKSPGQNPVSARAPRAINQRMLPAPKNG